MIGRAQAVDRPRARPRRRGDHGAGAGRRAEVRTGCSKRPRSSPSSTAPEDLASDGRVAVRRRRRARVARRRRGRRVRRAQAFDRAISALACLPGGGIAVALDGQRGARRRRRRTTAAASTPSAARRLHAASTRSPARRRTAARVSDGSPTQSRPSDWSHDLMELGRSGRLLELDLADRQRAASSRDGLAYAFGVWRRTATAAWVCESWRHRVVQTRPAAARPLPVRRRLPGYPSRIAPAAGGGCWLTVLRAAHAAGRVRAARAGVSASA